jgi:hypothetical protein
MTSDPAVWILAIRCPWSRLPLDLVAHHSTDVGAGLRALVVPRLGQLIPG